MMYDGRMSGIRGHAAAVALAVGLTGVLAGGAVAARDAGPFGRLAGEWSGGGTIDLVDGTHEPIKCRAAYDLLNDNQNVQLRIRCASDSYNFDLRGSVTVSGRDVTGTWTEATRNAGGKISGKAGGDKIDVVADGPGFTAGLTLVTRGRKQSVAIKSREAQSSLQAVNISLTRGG